MREKIDIHAHYFPPAYDQMLEKRGMKLLDGGFPKPEWNEEIQLSSMATLGISYSVLSISSPHLHMGDAAEAIEVARASNEYGAELMKKYPEKIGVLASLPLPEIDAAVEEVKYCRNELHVTGFALQTNSCGLYLGDARLDPVMEVLNQAESVVLIHPTEPAAIPQDVNETLPYPMMEFFFDTCRAVMNLILTGTLNKYPGIRFVIPHAGAYLPIISDRVASMSKMLCPDGSVDIRKCLADLYYDLGGTAMPKQYGNLCQITTGDHILYGSDTPFTPLPLCCKLAETMDEGLTAEMQELVYRENPKKLLSVFL